MKAFAQEATRAGRKARFFAVEDDDVGPEFSTLTIGRQPIWDPTAWPQVLSERKSLREQLRRARAKSVTVRMVGAAQLEPGAPVRRRMDALVARWRASRSMPPMGFLVHLDLYGHSEERRYFVAEQGDRLCGFVVAVPVYARGGWFFEDVLRDPNAPNGTVELLIDAAMTASAQAGSHWVSYGLAPLAEVGSRPLRAIRGTTRWLYNFQGVQSFKAKLGPSSWQNVYLAYPARERGLSAIIDTLRAFARGSLLRFAGATLLHRAPLVTWLMALLLLPWTTLLMAAPTHEWFPGPGVKAAWICFDMVLFVGLVRLTCRWTPRLAVGLAVAAAVDAGLGLAQAIAFNSSRARGPGDWLIIGLAVSAPAMACAFLALTRNHGSDAESLSE